MNLLEVDQLQLSLPAATSGDREGHDTSILRGLSFTLPRGGTLGLIGESGSGKSMTALALMGLLPEGARCSGRVQLGDTALHTLTETQWCRVRGRRIAMVFQEPMTALNPLHRIGQQLMEPLQLHRGLRGAAAQAEALRLLDRVQLPQAARRLASYPHQLSGGQRQRVMIAMALAGQPELLLADEPTTALDTTLQREVLDLIGTLVREDGMGLILISHDLDMVADRVQQVLVMRDGAVVESGPTANVFAHPAQPYTRELQAARPRLSDPAPARAASPSDAAGVDAGTPPLLRVQGLSQRYRLPREHLLQAAPTLQALQDVSFDLHAGRTLGVVGESGSGKSTLGRLVMALEKPQAGRVLLNGHELHTMGAAALRTARAQFQMVFQDPYGSLDPRRSVLQTVTEPLLALGAMPAPAEARERAAQALHEVGLQASDLGKFPHEFSGGQRQRIAIARALITRPRLIVADEALSALDVRVQAQVLRLLQDLQQRHGTAYLFISHDLAVVKQLCDAVLVLQHGRAVEQGAPQQLFTQPQHAHTQRLLAAMPGTAAR